MEVSIQSRNLEINDDIREHVTKKLNHVNSHLSGVMRALVEIASESTKAQEDRIVVQVTLDVAGSILRAEQRAANATAAINAVADVLERRVDRYKGKIYRSERARQTSLGIQQAEEDEQRDNASAWPIEERETLADGTVVRLKRFDMQPMSVEDAAFQMQLLGHTFFMFLNSQSNQYNLLYQRDEGDYGLIQPAVND